MPKTVETIVYSLPSFWAAPLINGDYTGTDEREDAAIDAFLASLEPGAIITIPPDSESYFTRWHDAPGILACDCYDYEISWIS
jgi:hypothetical protein